MGGRYDVIIIGSGAGGGTLAYKLAPSGLRILILERGGYLSREAQNWDSQAVFVEARYQTTETWLDKDGDEFHPNSHYFVGGNTKVYGAALLRMRERDFGEIHHQGGVSPAWPISYADMAPYYDQAEALYQVHGRRGSDPTEPSATGPYPYPALVHEPRIQRLSDDLERMKLHPFPLPLGLMRDDSDPVKSRCIRCSTCDGYPCLVNAKADAQVACVDPALTHSNVTLITNAYVEKLMTSPSGREVTDVVVDRNGVTDRFSADVVVVSCGAVNSAALLMKSSDERHPTGVGNRSGAVGRHYMAHINSAVLAVSKEKNPTVFQKTLGVNDFYFASDAWEFPMGNIQLLGKTDGYTLQEHAPKFAPGFALDVLADHAIDFWATTEDLPDWNNRIDVGREGKISLLYTPNNLEAHARLVAQIKAMTAQAGCHPSILSRQFSLGQKIPISGTAHQSGTVRFGLDPLTSALDINCKAHDLDNMYVVDSSFFPSISGVNPSLTIAANALRVGDRLLERLRP